VAVAEDVHAYLDWGTAVIDADGVVRPAVKSFEFFTADPFQARAVCQNADCRYQWKLRRKFDPERGEDAAPESMGRTHF
jgi:hypothetical protein